MIPPRARGESPRARQGVNPLQKKRMKAKQEVNETDREAVRVFGRKLAHECCGKTTWTGLTCRELVGVGRVSPGMAGGQFLADEPTMMRLWLECEESPSLYEEAREAFWAEMMAQLEREVTP